MGDETWTHHFEPEFRWQSMNWGHTTCSRKMNSRVAVSWQNLGHIFHVEEVVLLNFLPSAYMDNSEV